MRIANTLKTVEKYSFLKKSGWMGVDGETEDFLKILSLHGRRVILATASATLILCSTAVAELVQNFVMT